MKPDLKPLWTIDELGAQVALALSDNYEGAPNNRVREIPDLRTIRYYTTLGLLSRAAAMRGRTALYSQRHLYQLVAIKRLQAQGLTLAEIQQRLLGVSDSGLAEMARLPSLDRWGPEEPPVEAASGGQAAFWAAPPVTALEDHEDVAGEDPPNVPLQGIPLAEEVILLLKPCRHIEEEELPALRTAAAPLLKLLETRRLLRPRHERGTS
jgi:DNA-binding transcriptional MerR regulator